MDWKKYQELSKKWCEAGELSGETKIRFVKPGDEEINGQESRFEMADEVINLIKRANAEDEVDTLHQMFPPAHDPFVQKFAQLEESISSVVLTEDGVILFRKGSKIKEGILYCIRNNQVTIVPEAKYAGISRDKQYIALAYLRGIDLYEKEGKIVNTFQVRMAVVR